MLRRALTQISIFVAVAFAQHGEYSFVSQGSLSSITRMAGTQNGSFWTNTTTAPPEVTVEIQFDGLAGSGIIDSTSIDAACSSQSPFNANITSPTVLPIQPTDDLSPTMTPPANTTPVESSRPFTLPPTTANSSSVSNNRTNYTIPPASPTSANTSLFTSTGELVKTSPTNLLVWLLLALLPAAVIYGG